MLYVKYRLIRIVVCKRGRPRRRVGEAERRRDGEAEGALALTLLIVSCTRFSLRHVCSSGESG